MSEPTADEMVALAREMLDAYADTLDGFGYEHMGDMWRDAKPLAEGALALAARLRDAEATLRRIELYPVDVNSPPEDDLLAVKELARAALRVGEPTDG